MGAPVAAAPFCGKPLTGSDRLPRPPRDVGAREFVGPRVVPRAGPAGVAPLATRPLLLIGGLTVVLLIALSGRYGYHRDELYFLAAGRHPAWGYPDQPPLTPLLARALSALDPGSLVVLRLPSALIAGGVVMVTGMLSREFGAGRAGQTLAGGCMAVAGGTLAVTHTLSTTTIDLLCWTVLSYLIIRLLRGADRRWWLLVGVILGLGLQNKWLVAFFAGALLAGLAIGGPRQVLRSGYLWLAGLIALVAWAPDLIWQAHHGWPQFALSKSIAAGGSTSSQPWYLFIPLELLFMSPALVPIWGVGLWQLLRGPALKRFSAFGWAFVLLALLFLITGGKPYYLLGLYPVLFAAGAEPTVSWVRRGRGRARVRRYLLTAALVLSLVIDSIITLPVLPAAWIPDSPVLALNPDAGETIGWPDFARTVATVYDMAPAGAVILTQNYGEAGAIDRFGPNVDVPGAYSGHNGFGLWGPPPDNKGGSVVAVGFPLQQLQQWFGSVTPEALIDNHLGVDNEEQGRTVWLCSRQRLPWSRLWPSIRRLG